MADAYDLLGFTLRSPRMPVERHLPRAVGAASILLTGWALRLLIARHGPILSVLLGTILAVGSVMLVRREFVRVAAWGIALITLMESLWPPMPGALEPVHLLFWMTTILAVTEGLPHERALLVRTLVTSVYVFAGLAKLNPSWLSGEHLLFLAGIRPQLDWLGTLDASTRAALSVTVALAELAIPIALWMNKTRRVAMGMGVMAHILFVLAVHTRGLLGAIELVTLNGLLIAGYCAFWTPVAKSPQPTLQVHSPAQ